jgi:hypothetical protein
LVTIPTLAVSCFIGVMYANIEDYISLMGSFCAVIISFLIPGKYLKFTFLGMLYIKSNDYPISHYKNVLTIIIVGFLCLLGFTSGFLTIYGMIFPNSNN